MKNGGIKGIRAGAGVGMVTGTDQLFQKSSPLPKLTGIKVTDSSFNVIDDTAATTTGSFLLVGSGFTNDMQLFVGNTQMPFSYFSPTKLGVTLQNTIPNGTYNIYLASTTGSASILVPGLTISSFPAVNTTSYYSSGNTVNVQLIASGDAPLTYSVQPGSPLPAGLTLSSSGLLTGTLSLVVNTVLQFGVVINDAQAQTIQQTITLSVIFLDPQFTSTALLLSGGTATSPFYKDESTNNRGLSVLGDTRTDLFNPYITDGYYSFLFDGSQDSIKTSGAGLGATPFNWGTGDFTWETWIFPFHSQWSTTGNFYIFDHGGGNAGTLSYINNKIRYYNTTVGQNDSATGLAPTDAWTHLAVVRLSGTTKVYANGTPVLSIANDTYNYPNNSFFIGQYGLGGNYFSGYMSNVRLIKGTGIYTAQFTPPTVPATAITGTSLLTCQSNRIKDNSPNALVYGSTLLSGSTAPHSQPVAPFAPPSSSTGSVYFDGTGDYVVAPWDFNLYPLRTDSTFECWVYPMYTSGNKPVWASSAQPAGNDWEFLINGTTPYFRYYPGTPVTHVSSINVIPYSWNHIAFCFTASTHTSQWFINGVSGGTSTALNTVSSGTSAQTVNFGVAWNGDEGSGPAYYQGYMCDARFTNSVLYTTAFTPPTSQLALTGNTQLLTFRSKGSASNSAVIDSSPFNNIVTKNGNLAQGTFSPFSQTGWSYYYNGSTANSGTINLPAIAQGANLTIELWVYPTATTSGYRYHLIQYANFLTGLCLGLSLAGKTGDATAAVEVMIDNYSTPILTSTGTIPITTWSHIALVRNNNVFTVYLNGVANPATITNNLAIPATNCYLGYNAQSATNYYSGYLSNVRIVNGTAVYTSSSFTPPTQPLASITNTNLLTANSGSFVNVSPTGPNSVKAFSPFSPSMIYSPSTNGGSLYFDGTGDYLRVGNSGNSMFKLDSDFTIEFWIYPTGSSAGSQPIFALVGTPGSASVGDWGFLLSSNYVGYSGAGQGGDSFQISGAQVYANTWTHVALVRTSSNGTLTLFLNGNLIGTRTTYMSQTIGTGGVTIGGDLTASGGFTGYLSEFRILSAAMYSSNFTPSTSPNLTYNSRLLLSVSGINSGIIDSHSSVSFETLGDAQVRTNVKKYGNASMYFDGSGDYLSAPSDPMFALPKDYTIEAWIYRTDTGVQRAIVDLRGGSGLNVLFFVNSSNQLCAFNSTSTWINSTGTVPANQWVHVAIARSGTSAKLFINGVNDGTATNSDINVVSGPIYVGRQNGSTSNDWLGYIDELRITPGLARYTATFEAPPRAFLTQ